MYCARVYPHHCHAQRAIYLTTKPRVRPSAPPVLIGVGRLYIVIKSVFLGFDHFAIKSKHQLGLTSLLYFLSSQSYLQLALTFLIRVTLHQEKMASIL